MAYSSHLTLPQKKGASTKNKSKSAGKYVRVVHVVTSLDDPKCHDASYLNGVYYRTPKVATDEDNVDGLSFAYQGNVSSRTIPMEGEIVEITSYTGAAGPSSGGVAKYWVSILPIWNHPHHNATPDTKQPEWRNNLLGGVEEQSNVNPLQANPGDTLIEGRLSQTIRFGGFQGANTSLVGSSNVGQPLIVISNGQVKTDNGNTPIAEDVNVDANSIYMVSNHIIPLKPANSKRSAYTVPPQVPTNYIGNQVVINAGRLYFNAKEDSAFISAKDSIGLNANTLNFDAKEYMCIDASKIYLGAAARISPAITKQPVIKGQQFEEWMKILLDTLQNVSSAMQQAEAVSGGPVTSLIAEGRAFQESIAQLRTTLHSMLSNKVFTE